MIFDFREDRISSSRNTRRESAPWNKFPCGQSRRSIVATVIPVKFRSLKANFVPRTHACTRAQTQKSCSVETVALRWNLLGIVRVYPSQIETISEWRAALSNGEPKHDYFIIHRGIRWQWAAIVPDAIRYIYIYIYFYKRLTVSRFQSENNSPGIAENEIFAMMESVSGLWIVDSSVEQCVK